MKKIFFSLALLFSLSSFAADKKSPVPDLPPDAESADYQAILAQFPGGGFYAFDGLDQIFTLGLRNIEWLKFINASRPEGEKLSFTSKTTQNGYPIDKPSEYNQPIILAKLESVKAEMPKEMVSVIFEGKDFTKDPPVDTKIYLDMGRALDRVYQSAARWRTMQPFLYYLEEQRKSDVRGVYFLSRLTNRAEKLHSFESLPETEKTQFTSWLIGMCMNEGNEFEQCEAELQQKISDKQDLEAYYQSKLAQSTAVYNSFFEINAADARRDFIWSDSIMTVPFIDPAKRDVQHFVKDNIEDEWKFGNWNLRINFLRESGHPRIVFQPNITPHVNGLGGDTIYMNSNQPLTEYDANWTIRHEFGHVLALPDCYVEFYVKERDSIMNYQLDTENIMCSRRGHVKEIHYQELMKAYKN